MKHYPIFWQRLWRLFVLMALPSLFVVAPWALVLSSALKAAPTPETVADLDRKRQEANVTADAARATLEMVRRDSKRELQDLQKAVKDRDGELKTAQKNKENLQSLLADYRDRLKTAEDRFADLESSGKKIDGQLLKAREETKKAVKDKKAAESLLVDVRTSLSEKTTEVERLAKEIKALKNNTTDKAALEKALAEVRKEEAGKLKTARDAQEAAERKAMEIAKAKDKAEQEAQTAQKSQMAAEKARDELKARLETVPRPEKTDVYFVAMNAASLSLHRYKELFREFVDPTSKRKRPEGWRVGMALMDGAEWLSLAGFDADKAAVDRGFGQFSKAKDDATANLNDLKSRLVDVLGTSKAERKRCIVVAGLDCKPPVKSAHGDWKGLGLSVILIGSQAQATDVSGERLQKWLEFCDAVGGELTLLGTTRDPVDPDEALLERVRQKLDQATQPRYLGR